MSKFILVHDLFVKESDMLTGTSHIELNDVDADATENSFVVTETREQIFEMLK